MFRHRSVRTLCILFAVLAFALSTSAALAETYTSSGSKYPSAFSNNIFDTDNNDMQRMDSVYFGGKELVFFTLFSSSSESYDAKIFCYTPGYDYHASLAIGNSQDIDFQFKLLVFDNVLYLFYTPSGSSGGYHVGTVYYRQINYSSGSDGKDWSLTFGSEKSFTTGLSQVTLRTAALMNGVMYLVYTSKSSGYTWYYTASQDGVTFEAAVPFLTITDSSIKGAEGTVYQVPDATYGCTERLMVAYAVSVSGGNPVLKYFFFDGLTPYGPYTASTPSIVPYSVRLISGSAQGYSHQKYSVQVFLATPHDGDSQEYSDIYHAEYILGGENGEEGSWTGWTRLSGSSSDTVRYNVNAYSPEFAWALIPYYEEEDSNVRMYLHIWYARGTNYSWPSSDYVEFRVSSYTSDLLEYSGTATTGPEQQDLTTSPVIGIIEGTPPFPPNGGVPEDETARTSTVELAATSSVSTLTSVTVGGSVVVSYGTKFLGAKVGTRLSAALKYTKENEKEYEIKSSYSLHSFTDDVPGDLGWALVLKPEIMNQQYVLHAYDGSALSYGDDTSGDEFGVSVITYGDGTTISPYPYKLEDPTSTDDGFSWADAFTGMTARPLSTDIPGWQTVTEEYATGSSDYIPYRLPSFTGAAGVTSGEEICETTTSSQSYSPSASFSASAKLLGFDVDAKIAFSMKISTTTTMSGSLGFYYNLPKCGSAGSCISYVDVTPVIMVPANSEAGFSAPWISDDIRNMNKPKPWCLSYLVYPQGGTTEEQELTIGRARGNLFFSRKLSGRDHATLYFTLAGLPSDFELALDTPLHFRIGNYVLNTDSNPVLYRGFLGKSLVIQMREPGSADSSIRVTLTHVRQTGALVIALDADRIDLSGITAYRFPNVTTPPEGIRRSVPVTAFIGNRTVAMSDVPVTYLSRKNRWGRVLFRIPDTQS